MKPSLFQDDDASGLNYASESIYFQTGSVFFKELTNVIEGIRKLGKADVKDGEGVDMLISSIKHHSGLNVNFNLQASSPAVNPPALDRNNVLVANYMREFTSSGDGMRLIANSDGVVKGTVSLLTGKVSGIFADLAFTIHMPVSMLTSETYTPAEVAAVLLHEVGHILTYMEYLTRTLTTNQVLAGVSKALANTYTAEEREVVLVSAKKALQLKNLDTKELSKSKDGTVNEVVIISNIVRETESELGSNIYDLTSWEYLSDQFAARHGAGRDLATALTKMYKGQFNISFRNLPTYMACEALKLALVAFNGVGLFLMLADSVGNGVYDAPGVRLKRIRDQIVENLKDKKLSKEDIDALESDIKTIDVILKDVTDRRQFIGVIVDTIIPAARKARSQMLMQQELENIVSNELFRRSAELKLV